MPERHMTQQEFNRSLWRAIIPPLLLLAGHVAIITLLLFYWLQANTRWQHSERIVASTYDMERLLVNMETGIRGYLLSGDSTYLQPYNKAKAGFDDSTKELQNQLADRPIQQERLKTIEDSEQQWLEMEKPLLPMAQNQPHDPQFVALLNERKVIMDRMRQQIHEMLMTESESLSNHYDSERSAATLTILAGVGMSIMVAIGLALINRGTVLRLSQHYQTAIDEQAASNRQFHDLTEAIPQLMWITDSTGRHLYFNRPWSDYTGRSSDELSAEGWESTLHPQDMPRATSQWKEALQSGKPFESEYRLKQASDGSYRWFLCRATPVMDKSGKAVRWFGSCTDIEAKKQTERDRESLLAAERAARSDLMRISRIKDQFLATLSHELRTPMSAILGWARLLRDPTIRAKSLDRGVDAIETNAKAQARLIDDLLDMSRVITGKLTINAEQLDLGKIVRTAVDSIAPEAQTKKLTLTADISPNEITVNGDPARLQQVVLNLLGNALKFTPAGGSIEVSATSTDQIAQIVVRDSGQGIEPDFLPFVFERFRQADGSTTRQHGGLGLGLAIVKHLVELHGGTVTAASEGKNHGATFTVELPLFHNALDETDAPKAAPIDLAILQGKRLLIVDDDADSAMIVSTILEQSGVSSTVFGSAAAALEAILSKKFDAMISDIGMPRMDGYQLIRAVREAELHNGGMLPAIAFTAFARAEDRRAVLAAGYQAHVSKPIEPETLRATLAAVLTDHRGLPEAR